MCKNTTFNELLRFSASMEFNSVQKDESVIEYDFSEEFETKMNKLINTIRNKHTKFN